MKLNEIDAIETKQNQNYKQLSQAKPSHTPSRGEKLVARRSRIIFG